tara:strand:- start:180 stop:446 length:267 start_codon:yes stop_codon:yes gene_type:complete
MLEVIELTWNDQLGGFEEGRDFTWVNPAHIIVIQSTPLEVLHYDEGLDTMMPLEIFCYVITMVGGIKVTCKVECRETFYRRITAEKLN